MSIYYLLGCLFLLIAWTATSSAQIPDPAPFDQHVIDITNLQNTVTNIGSFGSIMKGYPSCEWPANTGNNYLNDGELWVGGFIGGELTVTTGRFSGNEWMPSEVVEVTTDETAYSDEDTYTRYEDLAAGPGRFGDHTPLGLQVSQRTLGWTGEDFIVHVMVIMNAGEEDLDSVYVAFCWDFNISRLQGGNFGGDDLVSFDAVNEISYMYDDDGNGGQSPGYIGGAYLNAPMVGHGWYSKGQEPLDDAARYEIMAGGFMTDPVDPGDYRLIQTVGPFDLPVDRKIPLIYTLAIGEGLSGLQGAVDASVEAVQRDVVATADSTIYEGELHEIPVIIGEQKRAIGRLQMAVDWEFCDVALTVVDPQGTEITPAMAVPNPYISYIVEPHRKAYEIINPALGLWTLRIRYLEGPGFFPYRHKVTVFGLPWDFGSPLETFQVANAMIFFPTKTDGTPGSSYLSCNGHVALQAGDSFDPDSNAVAFVMGSYREVIPKGSFCHWGDSDCDLYMYANVGPGTWGITLMILDFTNDRFYVFARKVNMEGITNPVRTGLAIGPHTGLEDIDMRDLGNRWVYP
jgi:hypothetical protein